MEQHTFTLHSDTVNLWNSVLPDLATMLVYSAIMFAQETICVNTFSMLAYKTILSIKLIS